MILGGYYKQETYACTYHEAEWVVAEKLDKQIYALQLLTAPWDCDGNPNDYDKLKSNITAFQNIENNMGGGSIRSLKASVEWAEASGGRNDYSGAYSPSGTQDGMYLIPADLADPSIQYELSSYLCAIRYNNALN